MASETTGPACQHCGSTDGYFVSDRANGWVEYTGTWDGVEERANGEDGLLYTRSATVKCMRCSRRSARPPEAERSPNQPADV